MSAPSEQNGPQDRADQAEEVTGAGPATGQSSVVEGNAIESNDATKSAEILPSAESKATREHITNPQRPPVVDNDEDKQSALARNPEESKDIEDTTSRDKEEVAPAKDVTEPAQEEAAQQSMEGAEQSGLTQIPLREKHTLAGQMPTNDYLSQKPGVKSPEPPPLPPKDEKFLGSQEAQATASTSEGYFDEKHPPPPEDDTVVDTHAGVEDGGVESRSEIQNIMDQFEDGGAGTGQDEIMSPRLELAQPVFQPPPRTSSLEPIQTRSIGSPTSPLQRSGSKESYNFSPASARPPSIAGGASTTSLQQTEGTESPKASNASIFQPPPPSPDPEPALPFDFHRFLEQLRHRTADPVARFLRSFLLEFGKKQWMVHEQVKIISDFLEFISKKMAQCEVWRTVSDAEFDNAREGMEKLVMNRLYSQTFSPAIPPPEVAGSRNKRNRTPAATTPVGPGRRGQHQEDVERDDVIAQKIRIYGWIREEHLDLAPMSEKGRKFLLLAQQELLKINSYRAPRDKVICILNCCKVIFGFLKNNKGDQSADAFIPLLIYTVLRANPEHLVSNVQYITRFRNQDKLGGEAGYYISSLTGVVTFVENLDRTSLTITAEEFEQNVEEAVSAITEGHKAEEYEGKMHPTQQSESSQLSTGSQPQLQVSEKSSLSRPEVTPRNSMDAERASPRRNASSRLTSSGLGSPEKATHSTSPSSGDGEEDNAAMAGLLRTIQKPLSTIGRIFSDDSPYANLSTKSTKGLEVNTSRDVPAAGSGLQPAFTPQPGSTPSRLSPAPAPRLPDRRGSEDTRRPLQSTRPAVPDRARSAESGTMNPSRTGSKDAATPGEAGYKASGNTYSAQDAAARQASAEAAEAQRIRVQEHNVVVE